MDEAELDYFQNTFYDDYLGEEEELMNDAIVKSGLLEFDSESEDDLFTVESLQPVKLPSHRKPTELPKEVTIKQEPLSEEDENESATREEIILPESTNIMELNEEDEDSIIEKPLKNPKAPQNNPKLTSVIMKNEPVLECDIKVENIEIPKDIVKKSRRQSYEEFEIKEEVIDLDVVEVKQEPLDSDEYEDTNISTSNCVSDTENTSISLNPVTSYSLNNDQVYSVASSSNKMGNSSCNNAIRISSLDDQVIGTSSNTYKITSVPSIKNEEPDLSDNSLFSSQLLRKRLELPQKDPPVKRMTIADIDKLSLAFHLPESSNPERVFSDYHFKIRSVDNEGLRTNYICLKCDQIVWDYPSVLSHPCFSGSTNSLPSLECFYCRRFIVSNVEFISSHFSGVHNYFLVNNHISTYKCCYKNCRFISPSSTCFSLHLKLTHCQTLPEKKDPPKPEFTLRKLELKKKLQTTLPPNHMIVAVELFNCQFCQNKFPTEFTLKKHMESNHEIRRRRDYKFGCNYCNYRAVFMSSLKVHLNFAHKRCVNIAKPTGIGKYMITKK